MPLIDRGTTGRPGRAGEGHSTQLGGLADLSGVLMIMGARAERGPAESRPGMKDA